MCIFGLKSKDKEIASSDIIVLKIIIERNGKLLSPVFSDEIWKEGVEKVVDFCIHEDKFDPEKGKYLTTTGIYSFEISYNHNFCLELFKFWGTISELKIYEAIIPKGSEYIKSGFQYCSNKLKLVKRKTNLEKKTAKSDIKCYVLLRDENYEIPYPDVSLNDKLSIKISGDNYYSGFYSFKYREEVELFLTYLGEKINLEIEEAIIPKNSDYVEVSKGYSFPVSKEHIEMSGFISEKLKIKNRI